MTRPSCRWTGRLVSKSALRQRASGLTIPVFTFAPLTSRPLVFCRLFLSSDIAFNATATEYEGLYHGKQRHQRTFGVRLSFQPAAGKGADQPSTLSSS